MGRVQGGARAAFATLSWGPARVILNTRFITKKEAHLPVSFFSYPQADSNRCCGNENPESWATRRWGHQLSGTNITKEGETVNGKIPSTEFSYSL